MLMHGADGNVYQFDGEGTLTPYREQPSLSAPAPALSPPMFNVPPPIPQGVQQATELWKAIRAAYPQLPDADISEDPTMTNGNAVLADVANGRASIKLRAGAPTNPFTMWHEAGHVFPRMLGPDTIREYWSARGLPGTHKDQMRSVAGQMGNHQAVPEEMMADDFALLQNPQYGGGAEQTFGIPYPREMMQKFYGELATRLSRQAIGPSVPPPISSEMNIPGLAPGVNPFASIGK